MFLAPTTDRGGARREQQQRHHHDPEAHGARETSFDQDGLLVCARWTAIARLSTIQIRPTSVSGHQGTGRSVIRCTSWCADRARQCTGWR